MSIEVISCEVGRPSQSILQMGQTSSSGLLPIEKVAIPIVDVLNLNNFTKHNEY